MCDCIERIDEDLKSEDQCLDATMFGHRKATMMLIRKDKWKHENRRKKPTRVIATYCPFCGEKYPAGDRGALSYADSDGRQVAGGMQMSATEGAITRRPAHPKDTISGGPIGPSDADTLPSVRSQS